jgi:serine/threonine-protein kinase
VNGNDPDTRRRYATLLYDLGRLPDAIAELRRAVDLDPMGQAWIALGSIYQGAGELDEAEKAIRHHLQIAPDTLGGLVALGRNELLQSRPKDALATFEHCGAEDYALWGKALAEYGLGHPDASQAALDALIARYAHTSAFRIAEAHAWRGEKDAAFKWLDRAVPAGQTFGVKLDPFLRSLRSDPRFAALLRKMHLPVE